MNQFQMNYLNAKTAYDTAFNNEDWALVEELEDAFLDSQFELYDWMSEVVISTGQISREDVEMIRRNSNIEQWDKMLDMGLRLQA